MLFPPNFDKQRAVELGKLVRQAYKRFDNYKKDEPWSIQDGYEMICEISYRTFLSFDVNDAVELTAIDKEMESVELPEQEAPVSFAIGDSLFRDVPMGFLVKKDGVAYLIFRGTVTPREWIFDANIRMVPYRLDGWGKVSDGFQNIYNRCRDSFMKKLSALPADMPLYIAGHSLGGALTLMAVPDVIASTPFKKPVLYNFGCPRVGDSDFAKAYDADPGPNTFRVVNTSDLVTSIPLPVEIQFLPSGYYTHVGWQIDFAIQYDSLGKNHAMDMYIEVMEKVG